jgi:hypothetical protein
MICQMSFRRVVTLVFVLLIAIPILGGSSVALSNNSERVRAYTRDIEFDYIQWILDALGIKLTQQALGVTRYMPEEERRQTALEYLKLVQQIQQDEGKLNNIYADPNVSDPQSASVALRQELNELYARRAELAPLAEAVLQEQTSEIVAEMGLSMAGQPVPPVLYHSSPLPLALIVSPRDTIRQDQNISLLPDLTVDQEVTLEDKVDHNLDVSSLVVGVGGIGVYPTMVMQTSDLNWLSEVIAHEWIHNYLSLRPLGVSYLNSPELRTMNETTAAIAGKEIGRAVIERYYPELLPPPPQEIQETTPEPPTTPQPPAFDFRKEMHETRLAVDQFLSYGLVDDAERFMEERRQYFWQQGYRIRKLNQAYFAFYGAYADQPGGAAGADPVGEAVRALRASSPTLADFVNKIAWMSSFDQLQRTVSQTPARTSSAQ